MKYRHIACGGTFDFLHAGHITLLHKAFSLSNRVSVGITSDTFANKLGKRPYNNFFVRKTVLEKFLAQEGLLRRAFIIKLEDIFGTTISDDKLQAIIVTKNSRRGAFVINNKRKDSNLDPLKLITCELKEADDGVPISSSRIKVGEISPSGVNYFAFLKKNNFALPIKLRPTLGKSFGEIVQYIKPIDRSNLLITVGDQTTFDCLSTGITPDVSVLDYKIQRAQVFQTIVDLGFSPKIKVFSVKNSQGVISQNLSQALEKSILCKQKNVLVVDGEDDLAVLPAVLLSPIGTEIYYGLRGVGLVRIAVDVECKNIFWTLLEKFVLV